MKTLLQYIKKISVIASLILLILIPTETKSGSLSVFTETPIIVNPESEYEGLLIDFIIEH